MATAKSRLRSAAKSRAASRSRPKSATRATSRSASTSKRATGAAAKRAASKRTATKRATPKRAVVKRGASKRAATPKRAVVKRVPTRPAKTKRPPERAVRPAPLELAPRPGAPAVPNGIGLVAQHLDFTTHDLDGVRRFYTELLGFSKFEHDPGFDYLNVSIAPGVSIGFMPPMPGPPDQWRPPREPALYLVVENVDQACAALTQKGVTFDQPPADMPWGDRAAVLRDPEGRMVWIAQHLQKG